MDRIYQINEENYKSIIKEVKDIESIADGLPEKEQLLILQKANNIYVLLDRFRMVKKK